MQKLSTLPFILLVSLLLAGCAGNPLVHTAQDGTEVRFDDLKGSIEFAYASIAGVATAIKNSKDSGAMSDETAGKLKTELQKSLEGVAEAERLLALGDIEGATLEVKASRLVLEVVKSTSTRSGINFEEAQL